MDSAAASRLALRFVEASRRLAETRTLRKIPDLFDRLLDIGGAILDDSARLWIVVVVDCPKATNRRQCIEDFVAEHVVEHNEPGRLLLEDGTLLAVPGSI